MIIADGNAHSGRAPGRTYPPMGIKPSWTGSFGGSAAASAALARSRRITLLLRPGPFLNEGNPVVQCASWAAEAAALPSGASCPAKLDAYGAARLIPQSHLSHRG